MAQIATEKKVNIPEQVKNPAPVFPCKDCGRKFNKEALQHHAKACKKVFGEKREEFHAKVVDDEAIKLREASDDVQIDAELKKLRKEANEECKKESAELRKAVEKGHQQATKMEETTIKIKAKKNKNKNDL